MATSKSGRFARTLLIACLTVFTLVANAGPKGGGSNQGSGSNQGGSNSSGPSGGGNNSSGSSNSMFETQMLAYGAVNQIANAVAQRVCALKNAGTLVIFDQTSFQNLQAWQSFQASAEALTTAYQTLTSQIIPQPSADGSYPASSTLGSQGTGPVAAPQGFFAGSDVSGLISAVAASTTNTASSFTVPDSAMATAILHQMARVKTCSDLKRIYYPLFGNAAILPDATNDINAVMLRLNNARFTILHILDSNSATSTSPLWLATDHLNTDYDQLLNTLATSVAQNQTTASATAGPNPGITSIVQGAQIARLLKQQNTYLLYANVISAGGTQRDRKNLFTILFTGDFITYSGGAIVNYALTESATDTLLDADVLRYRSSFTSLHAAHESAKVESVESGDNLLSLCGSESHPEATGGSGS